MDELNIIHNLNFTNINYNIDSIINKLKVCDNIDEIKDIINRQHNIIFTYDNLNNGNREGVQELFTSMKFLDVMDNISGTLVENLKESEIIFINKIIYDYFEYTKQYNSTEINSIKDKLLSISYSINSSRIYSLAPVVGVNKARLLSILSYSSYKTEKIVHRINNFILNTELNKRDISNIYYIIYDGPPMTIINNIFEKKQLEINNKFVDMFCYSMFEYCDSDDPEIIEMFNKISSVLMDRLIDISIPLDNPVIYRVLLNYSNMISIMNIDRNKLRFSIKEHNNSEALKNAINNIEKINNIEIY
jgi:hypothetical protein